jgi:hypothetical protein
MRWVGHVAGNGRKEVHRGFRCSNLIEKDHVEDLGLDGRKILRFIFQIWDGLIWLNTGTGGGRL